MKALFLVGLILASVFAFSSAGEVTNQKERSQTLCAGCVIVVEMMEQMINLRGEDVEDFVNNKFCPLFPSEIKAVCNLVIRDIYGPSIIDAIKNGVGSDQFCYEIDICNRKECKLNRNRPDIPNGINPLVLKKSLESAESIIGNLDIIDWIIGIIEKIKERKPIVDIDGDFFSASTAGLRGYNWRGRDCNDLDSKIYPGRKHNPYPSVNMDYSCNGIHGTDPGSRRPFKEIFCADSKQLGVGVLGDSAGAKFTIPPAYMNASLIDQNTFKNLYRVLINEIDEPHKSAFTGFHPGTKDDPSHSVYQHLRNWNLCNHRDYQNIAVNGARSSSVVKNSQSLSRNATTDHPMLLFFELIGNDVCSSRHNFDRMTTPAEFYHNIKNAFMWLDTRLPKGSHVFVLGLANGSVLYEKLWNREHPIGFKFYEVYDFLNCLNLNPCWGWLNSNSTVRQMTTDRAMQLNDVYRRIIAETGGKYKNFDIVYYDYPAEELINYWEDLGNDPAELIEPIDGFHPSGKLHSLLADWIWEKILTTKPEWIGPRNRYNNVIVDLFGEQGGH